MAARVGTGVMAKSLSVASQNSTPEGHRVTYNGNVQLGVVQFHCGHKPGTLPDEEQGVSTIQGREIGLFSIC